MLTRSFTGVVRNEAGAKSATKKFHTQRLGLQRGDDFLLKLQIIDEDGAAVPLAGCAVYWSVATPGGVVKIKKQSNIVDAANGRVEQPGAPGDTTPLSLGDYEHDWELVDSAGKSTKVMPSSPVLLEKSPYVSSAPVTLPLAVPPLALQLPSYTNATRPAPAALVLVPIWNTDLEQIQISTGAAWLTVPMEGP